MLCPYLMYCEDPYLCKISIFVVIHLPSCIRITSCPDVYVTYKYTSTYTQNTVIKYKFLYKESLYSEIPAVQTATADRGGY